MHPLFQHNDLTKNLKNTTETDDHLSNISMRSVLTVLLPNDAKLYTATTIINYSLQQVPHIN